MTNSQIREIHIIIISCSNKMRVEGICTSMPPYPIVLQANLFFLLFLLKTRNYLENLFDIKWFVNDSIGFQFF